MTSGTTSHIILNTIITSCIPNHRFRNSSFYSSMTKYRIKKKLHKFLPYVPHTALGRRVGVLKWMDLPAARFNTCTELVTTIKGEASLLPCGCRLATVTSHGFWPQLTRQMTSCSEQTCVSRLFLYVDCPTSYMLFTCLFIYVLFKDGVSSWDSEELNGMVNTELQRMLKEAGVAKSEVLSRKFLGGV